MSARTDGNVRAEAARAVHALRDRGVSLERALPDADLRLADSRDRALLRALVFATVRASYRLDALVAMLVAQPFKPRDRIIHALVMVGIAQLSDHLTPEYAAISGTAEAARVLERPRFVGLVNASLRRFQREHVALIKALPVSDPIRHEHPQWLVDALRHDWGDAASAIMAANLEPAPLWLRVNRQRGDRDAYRAALDAGGPRARVFEPLPDALVLDDSRDVGSLPGFDQGDVSVQDGAAQLALELLDLAPGLRVLDACAAPGGKSAHVLERAPPGLTLVALDPRPERAERLAANFARLRLSGYELRIGDATEPAAWWDGRPFDRILVDAPCSGTGVIRRHPDIRLLRRSGDIAAHAALQARLLDALWPLLAGGGRLVYATCSVLADENARQIAAFLARTPAARALDAVPAWFGRESGAGRQNLPGEGGMDGFYYAVLERTRGAG
ncbi:MAG TPA: 16S rRNA (cytosine(967)-C(5))-methyltransferase RsmB [Candidatus Saccharimonadia bacterium]|nr:16S rRNA (cytosine(967)-C(5))-methyltransferase RsmB [Candidatus Saccharimonadia bacterium]